MTFQEDVRDEVLIRCLMRYGAGVVPSPWKEASVREPRPLLAQKGPESSSRMYHGSE